MGLSRDNIRRRPIYNELRHLTQGHSCDDIRRKPWRVNQMTFQLSTTSIMWWKAAHVRSYLETTFKKAIHLDHMVMTIRDTGAGPSLDVVTSLLDVRSVVSQGVTINTRKVSKMWLQRDFRQVRVSMCLLLDSRHMLFTYWAPSNDWTEPSFNQLCLQSSRSYKQGG